MNISIEYKLAYVQVLEVLKGLSKIEYERIPKERIKLYETYKDKNYEFKLDSQKDFNNQISPEAQKIIANLFVKFIATPEDRLKIYEEEKKNFVQKEFEERKKLQLNPLFEENKKEEVKQVKETALIVKKEGFLTKFIEKLKEFFRIGIKHG